MKPITALLYALIALFALALVLHVAGDAAADNNDAQKVPVSFYIKGEVDPDTGQEGNMNLNPPSKSSSTVAEAEMTAVYEVSGDGSYVEIGTWRSADFFTNVNLAGSDFEMFVFAQAPEGTDSMHVASEVMFRATINGNTFESNERNLNEGDMAMFTLTGTLSGTISSGEQLSITLEARTNGDRAPPPSSDDGTRPIEVHYDSYDYTTNISTYMPMMSTGIEFTSQNKDESVYRFSATHALASRYIAQNTFDFEITGAYEDELPWRNATKAFLSTDVTEDVENSAWYFDVTWLHGKQSGGVYPGSYNAMFIINDTVNNQWQRDQDFTIDQSEPKPDFKTIGIQLLREKDEGRYEDAQDDVALYDNLVIKVTFSVSAEMTEKYSTNYLFFINEVPYPDSTPYSIQINGSNPESRLIDWSPQSEGYVNITAWIDPNNGQDEGEAQEDNNWKKVMTSDETDVFVQDMKRPTAIIKTPAPADGNDHAYVNISSDDREIKFDGSDSTDPDDLENLTYVFSVRKIWPSETDWESVPTDNNGIGTFEMDDLPTDNELWEARLEVTDGSNRMDTAIREFTINVPPQGEIDGPEDGDMFITGTNIEFESDFYDVNNNEMVYRWRSSLHVETLSTDANFETTELKAGRHKITLRVSDKKGEEMLGGVTEVSIFIFVNTPPEIDIYQPNLNLDPIIFETGEEISFDASDSFDPDGDDLEFEWRGDNKILSSDAAFTKTYTNSGEYEIKLRIWDLNDGDRIDERPVEEEFTIIITTRPIAVINGGDDVVKVYKGKTLTLNGDQSYDEDGDAIDWYMWDMDGNGNFEAEGNNPRESTVYDKTGEFIVRLKVVDEYGAESEPVAIRVKVEKKDTTDPIPGFMVSGSLIALIGAAGILYYRRR